MYMRYTQRFRKGRGNQIENRTKRNLPRRRTVYKRRHLLKTIQRRNKQDGSMFKQTLKSAKEIWKKVDDPLQQKKYLGGGGENDVENSSKQEYETYPDLKPINTLQDAYNSLKPGMNKDELQTALDAIIFEASRDNQYYEDIQVNTNKFDYDEMKIKIKNAINPNNKQNVKADIERCLTSLIFYINMNNQFNYIKRKQDEGVTLTDEYIKFQPYKHEIKNKQNKDEYYYYDKIEEYKDSLIDKITKDRTFTGTFNRFKSSLGLNPQPL